MLHGIARAAAGLVLAAIVGCGETAKEGPAVPAKVAKKGISMTMGLMPRLVGTSYADACKRGAEEAGRELGVKVVFDGPTEADVSKQSEILDSWIDQRMDAIAVAPSEPHALAPTLRKAMRRDIKVLTWDADSDADSREAFVNPATYQGIGFALVDAMAAEMGGKGDVAALTGTPATTTQKLWIEEMRKRITATCPGMNIATVDAMGEDHASAYQMVKAMLKERSDLRGIVGLTPVALIAAAKAVFDSDRAGKVAVTGIATPNEAVRFIKNGAVKTVVMWNAVDLGYLAVHVARKLFDEGQLPEEFEAGRLGRIRRAASHVLLGPPMRITRENIDKFDF